MLYALESDALRVVVSNTGAELQSIFAKRTHTELLWQGDPAHWGSRAPVLFPAIGASKDGGYTHAGRRYAMPKHGLVRRAYFYGKQTRDTLVFKYVDNPLTRAAFPFAFTFTVTFTLTGDTLRVDNTVDNLSVEPLYCNVGAHEAYNCDFGGGYLVFEQAEVLRSEVVDTKTGLLTGAAYAVPLADGGRLNLTYDLFENDALVFRNIRSKKITLYAHGAQDVIELAYDAPHMGVWTKPGAPFVCLEPWWGLPDYADADGALARKDGVVPVAAGASFTCGHTIRVV